jgi:hypothetical protein
MMEALIQKRVKSNRRFAELAVTDDELPLT